MRSIRLLGVLLATFGLTACLNSTTLVKLKPDGSGTVEQTTLMNMAALKGMMPGGANGSQAPQGPLMNKDDLERTAQRMGKGVRLVSTEPVKGDKGFEGTRAIFSFDDINQVQISQDPGGGSMNGGNTDSPVKFAFTRNAGGTSTLTINFNDKPVGDASAKPELPKGGDMPDLTNPMIMNMIKTMFDGFKINIGVEVAGSIVKTNAEYVTGPHLTLLEMDMPALLADEAKLKALQGKIGPGASFSDVKPYLKDIKGIKIDGPSIRVEFK